MKLGNAFFMQGIGTLTFGSSGPLWSLSYEFWYYVLFPLMLLAFPLGKAGWTSVLYGAAARGLNLAPEERGKPGYLWVAAAVGSAVLVVAALNFKTDINASGDFAVAAAAAVLIFAILRSSASSRSGLYSRAACGLAGFSYTLYLVHAPLMVFVSAWLVPPQMWQPNASHVAIGATPGIVTFAYALSIAQFTEWRTDAVRRRVADALGRRASSHLPLHSSSRDG